ncbi:MAG: beta-lactamase class A [Saprospiraceae bacterium]|jgi:beta-lactamase class A
MIKHLLTAALMLVFTTIHAQKIEQLHIPCFEGGADLSPLSQCNSTDFQAALEQTISRNPKWKRLLDDKKLAIGLVDLRDTNNVRFAQLNGNEMMYAASLPKIAILLSAMDAFEKKEMAETREIKKDLKLMINRSDNKASTRMIDRLGYKKIEAVLTDPRYKFYDKTTGGGLWVGKRYASGGARNPDPLKGLSHAATATQICRFYYMMMQGKLVSTKRSQEMLKYMADSHIHHKFVNSLNIVAPSARVFRKSGSWQSFHSDSALVWGPKRKYILTALVDHPDGEKIMRALIYEVEKLINKAT